MCQPFFVDTHCYVGYIFFKILFSISSSSILLIQKHYFSKSLNDAPEMYIVFSSTIINLSWNVLLSMNFTLLYCFI